MLENNEDDNLKYNLEMLAKKEQESKWELFFVANKVLLSTCFGIFVVPLWVLIVADPADNQDVGNAQKLSCYTIALVSMVISHVLGKLLSTCINYKDASKTKCMLISANVLSITACFLLASASMQNDLWNVYQ